jgi:peptidoglycan/LPS O-acetylase OafA/YrhL
MAVALLVATMLVWAALDEWRYGDVASQLESFFVGLATFGLLLYAPHWRLLRQRGLPRLHELLRALGERSYSLYLLHAPLLQLSWLWFVQRLHLRSAGWQAIVEMASGALLAVLVSEVFYRVVEKPTHRWSRGLGLARRPAMSPAAQSA